jgi:hypothetical protein
MIHPVINSCRTTDLVPVPVPDGEELGKLARLKLGVGSCGACHRVTREGCCDQQDAETRLALRIRLRAVSVERAAPVGGTCGLSWPFIVTLLRPPRPPG